jgi:monofunctional biosynthetic peptidoglycan transglycosylase
LGRRDVVLDVPASYVLQSVAAAIALSAGLAASVQSAEQPAGREGRTITEFDGADDIKWTVVDDGVMGGLSQGRLTPSHDGIIKFSGTLSLENNGGFSSFRSGDVALDLGSYTGLVLRVKGDGRTYQVRLATDARYRGMEVSFSAEFATTKGEWIEVKVPFDGFKASFRGTDLPDQKFDPSKIRRLGILLGDKKQAPFEIELDCIRTYAAGAGEHNTQ